MILKEEWRSGTLGGRVLLRNVTARAEGTYKCEVSTEGPIFDTDYKLANLTVIGNEGNQLPLNPPPFLPQQFNYEFILVSGGFVMKMTGAGASTCHLSSGTALRCRRPALRFRIASMPVALSPWSHLSQVRWQVD